MVSPVPLGQWGRSKWISIPRTNAAERTDLASDVTPERRHEQHHLSRQTNTSLRPDDHHQDGRPVLQFRRSLAKYELLDLASGCSGQRPKHHGLGDLETGQMLAAMQNEVVGRNVFVPGS